MALSRRLLPNTIAGQITSLVIIAVVLGVGLASAVLFVLFSQGPAGPNSEILAAVRAARIATIVHEAAAASSFADLQQKLRRIHPSSVDVSAEPIAALPALGEPSRSSPLTGAIETMLKETWGIVALPGVGKPGDDAVYVKVGDETALRFDISPHGPPHFFVFVETICALAIITFIILFLSIYAVRWITSPLSAIASAARSFGRVPDEDELLDVTGPVEIAQAATALNDMRTRVRSLVNERTRMLVAISHDLRTPLTRLRLRVDRVKDAPTRTAMLQDIAIVDAMLGETLAYVREGNPTELAAPADLPSLLQTICAQFADMGHDVAYRGPDRVAFMCRAQSLGRAVTNIVENATKNSANIEVELHVLDESTARIDVTDNGPGIPPALLARVFEPFFKVDSARPLKGGEGFGLGLSIARDIVERHGGEIAIANRPTSGLEVRLTLRALPAAMAWEVARRERLEIHGLA
jgi:signal transduction histidine kinase